MALNIEHLNCIICHDLPENKIFQCPNGHLFCEFDYLEWRFKGAGHEFCAYCQVKFSDEPIRCKAAEETIEKLKISCKNQSKGCLIKLDKVI